MRVATLVASAPDGADERRPQALTAIGTVAAGLAGLAVAGCLSVAATLIHGRWASVQAAQIILVASALFWLSTLAGALVLRRASVTPARVALVTFGAATVVCCGFALYVLVQRIVFPADILIWAESDFVNDIIKLRRGYPLYTEQANNESFVYPPGAQVLTYGLASLVGQGTSIAAFRAVQLLYTVAAAGIATLAVRRLLMLAGVRPRRPVLWAVAWTPLMLLIATNPLTNDYIVYLHNDALSQLISVVAFWACLEYGASARRRWLVVLTVLPAIGVMVKQSLAIWALLAMLFLLISNHPRARWRAVGVGAAGVALVALAMLGGVLVWGEHYWYWTVTVLGAHGVSPLRSVQHALEAWVYFAGGLLAALVLVRGQRQRVMLAAAVVWLSLLGMEAYTSGIAWMLNHMGPGSLIAGIWIAAALATLVTERGAMLEDRTPASWVRGAITAAVGVFLLAGLQAVRIPARPFGDGAARYVAAIEHEMAADPETTLLDTGSWVYLRGDIMMKDRAPSIGERGFSGTGDFSGMISRIAERRYSKILVRAYSADDSWYDEPFWDQRSGIRAALDRHYVEVRRIPTMETELHGDGMQYLFRDISVLVPRGS